MSASNALNPEQTGPMQLPMFMTASDYVASLTGSLDSSWRPVEQVLEQKLAKSKQPKLASTIKDQHRGHGTGVYRAVEREGVLNPVQMVHGMGQNLLLGQGGHRAAAAEEIERQTGKDVWLPVIHTDAREGSATPVSLDPTSELSEVPARRAAAKDAQRFIEDTPAIGSHIMWRVRGR